MPMATANVTINGEKAFVNDTEIENNNQTEYYDIITIDMKPDSALPTYTVGVNSGLADPGVATAGTTISVRSDAGTYNLTIYEWK